MLPKKKIDMTLAKTVKELRLNAGMTLDDIAEEFGVTKASVSRWERGGAPVPLEYWLWWFQRGKNENSN